MRGLLGRPPRGALGLLLGLDPFPGALDAGRLDVAVLVREDVRVTADHLAGDRLDHIAERERVLLLSHPGVIDHLQQQVAEFLAQIVEIAARDRIRNLIGLLDRVGRDGLEILHEVPRAAGHRRAQRSHDLDQAGNVAGRGHGAPLYERYGRYAKSALSIPAKHAGNTALSTDWPRRRQVLNRVP